MKSVTLYEIKVTEWTMYYIGWIAFKDASAYDSLKIINKDTLEYVHKIDEYDNMEYTGRSVEVQYVWELENNPTVICISEFIESEIAA